MPTPPRLAVFLTSLATALLALSACASTPPAVKGPDPQLLAAIANPARAVTAVARDASRHPAAELAFFGIKPSMTVVEIWPGGGYWTEILGHYLAAQGQYWMALPVMANAEESPGRKRLRALIAGHNGNLGTIREGQLGANAFNIAPPGSADLVLTFRNLHNWMEDGFAEQAIAECFRALKPGGILGVEEHRGRNDQPQDPKGKSGYVRQDYAIALIEKAGFEFAGASEINANPKDTKDWPDGVWTLPPTLTLGEKDREKYLAIGEADNFVLKFRKPKR